MSVNQLELLPSFDRVLLVERGRVRTVAGERELKKSVEILLERGGSFSVSESDEASLDKGASRKGSHHVSFGTAAAGPTTTSTTTAAATVTPTTTATTATASPASKAIASATDVEQSETGARLVSIFSTILVYCLLLPVTKAMSRLLSTCALAVWVAVAPSRLRSLHPSLRLLCS